MKKKEARKTVLPKDFQCKICNKSGFTSSYKLKSHMFMHRAVPARYKCSFCSKEYFRSDEYSRHLATHTKSQKHCYCDICGRGFVDKRNLIQHLNIHDDLPIRSNRYNCIACETDYCEERLLKYHIRKHHLNLHNSKSTNNIHMTKNLNETWLERVEGTGNFVEITKVKPTMLRIKKAKLKGDKLLKEADGKTTFQQYIASVFATKDNYYSKAICDYCGKEMLKKSILPHIRERHLKIRRFHCDVCGRSFNRHYQLCLHNCGQVRRRRTVKKLENV